MPESGLTPSRVPNPPRSRTVSNRFVRIHAITQNPGNTLEPRKYENPRNTLDIDNPGKTPQAREDLEQKNQNS